MSTHYEMDSCLYLWLLSISIYFDRPKKEHFHKKKNPKSAIVAPEPVSLDFDVFVSKR